MNIEQAKAIPITLILDKLNHPPQRTNGYKVNYFTPLRREKTPSLWVDTKANLWRDFGDFKWIGGDGIHLVRAYLESQGENKEVSDALRWLRNMTGFIPTIKPVIDPDEVESPKTLVLKHVGPIKRERLIEYGNERGIPEQVIRKYFLEAAISNSVTGKKFYALSMRNDLKGYELRNPYFKGCIGKKYITFIRGTIPKPDGVNYFEGSFDFLSAITQRNGQPFEDDSVILHSLSNLKKGAAYTKNYGYKFLYSWMDNDKPGIEATNAWDEFCKTEEGLIHVPKNDLYSPYKDVNAAHIAKLEL